MPKTPDPFATHPELRTKISDPLQSFFRTFNIETMTEMLVERGLPVGWWHSDATREASRTKTLKDHGDDDLWIFAYGSLMWDPAFVFTDVRKCHVPNYARRFILKDIRGGRGDPQTPGLFAALDNGEGCDGLAFKIANHTIDVETEILWRRELVAPGYIPTFVDAIAGDQHIQALTFVADHDADVIEPSISREKQVQMIATATGILGSNLEYLENIAINFDTLGVTDNDIADLLHQTHTYIKAQHSKV